MKNLFFALFAVVALGFASCGDSGCDLDLAGVYTGTETCAGVATDSVTVTVTGTEGNYGVTVSSRTLSTIEQDGCTLTSETSTILGSDITEFEFSEGSVTFEQRVLGVTTCTFTGTK